MSKEKPQEIRIETLPFVKKPCDVCGKPEKSQMYLSGPFRWLCPECETIADTIINQYVDYLLYYDLRTVVAILSEHIEQRHKPPK
jgi:hypothetical protein